MKAYESDVSQAVVRPRRFSSPEMNRVGVMIIGDPSSMALECATCGARWSPCIQPGGRMPRRYWQCPASCNA